jgi:hypothetical protein
MDKKRQDLRDLKLSEEQIDVMLGAELVDAEDEGDSESDSGGDYSVLPENWESVQVFLALSLCWRVDGFNGIYLGLDRPGIESTLRLLSILPERHREIFEDLRIMENSALELLNREQ